MLIPPRHGKVENTVDVGLRLKVLLDGVPQHDCFEYHLDESWVVVAKRDEDGMLVIDAKDNIVTEKKLGSVTVEVLEDG